MDGGERGGVTDEQIALLKLVVWRGQRRRV